MILAQSNILPPSFTTNSRQDELLHEYIIYKLVNPEGRVYIGCTMNMKCRVDNYRSLNQSCKRQRLLYESLVKYGYANHEMSVIDTFTSNKSYACGKEIFWIRSYMSNVNKWPGMNGLNLSDGGVGSRGMILSENRKREIGDMKRGVPMSEEQKKKLSDYNKSNPSMGMLGKHHTQEFKDYLSLIKIGTPSPFKGNHHSLETRIAASKSRLGKPSKLKGRKLSPEVKAKMDSVRNTKRKPIILEKDGEVIEFRSIIAAYTFLGVSKGFFHNIINGADGCVFNGYYLKYKI